MSNTTIEQEIKARHKELTRAKERLERELEHCPPGKICIAKSPTRIQYYLRKKPTDKTGEYLAADKQKLIKIYLQKSYNEKAIKSVKYELEMLDKFLERYGNIKDDIRNIFSSMPIPVKELLEPIDVSDADYANWWSKIPFERKQMIEDKVEYVTDRGEHVRSKSELLIANTLNRMNIPYKYECPLELRKGLIIHPDFTVLNVSKRKVMYWEHRGMMDDRDYAKHSVLRIKDYGNYGIILGKNLIITEETSTAPLSTKEISRMIDCYLLDK